MRIRNPLLGFLFVLLVVVGLVSCGSDQKVTQKKDEVRVSAILNLTGPAARFDAIKKKTLSLAVKRLKTIYPNVNIQVNFLDAGGGPEATNVAVRRALSWNSSYFLSGTSPTALAIASQVRNHSPVLIQMANAANPDFGPPKAGEYRMWPDWKQEAEIVMGIIKKQGIERLLLIYSADPYSNSLANELNQLAKGKTEIKISQLQYDPAATFDFRPSLLRAKDEEIQAIVIFGLPPGIRALIGQMAEVKWDKILIGGVNINLAVKDFDSAKLSGSLWLIETEAMKEKLSPGSEAQLFRSAYKKEYGENPAFHSLYLADSLYLIAAAHAGYPTKNLSDLDRIVKIKQFDSASGKIKLNADGTFVFEMSARKVR